MKRLFCIFLTLLLISTMLLGCGQEDKRTETEIRRDIHTKALHTFQEFDECKIYFDGSKIDVTVWDFDKSLEIKLLLSLGYDGTDTYWSNLTETLQTGSTSLRDYAQEADLEYPSVTVKLLVESDSFKSFLDVCDGEIVYDVTEISRAISETGVLNNDEDEPPSSSETEAQETVTDTTEPSPETQPAETKPDMTAGQQTALWAAEDYLKYSPFSHDGLIHQLEYEGFSTEDATFAADNCGADWNEQALKKAKDYLNFSAFSYKGLIRQLEYEKYTTEQATYGADNCGADWNEQAAKKAKEYLDFSAFSRSKLIDQLVYEGFTKDQAVYGVEQNGL